MDRHAGSLQPDRREKSRLGTIDSTGLRGSVGEPLERAGDRQGNCETGRTKLIRRRVTNHPRVRKSESNIADGPRRIRSACNP